MESLCYYTFPIIGEVGIAEEDGKLTSLVFCKAENERRARGMKGKSVRKESADLHETPLLQKAAAEISEYLDGKRTKFDLPLEPRGTVFQRAVLQALQTIPFGKTKTYGEIAVQIGKPKACRAIGMANNRNPIAIIIPCHRVIGADGSLTGYDGGLDIKKRLLDLEKSL